MARKADPERREQYLQAALKLFLYFPRKQELIQELILQISREQSAYMQSILDPHASVRDTFQTIWEGYFHWFLQHMDAYLYVRQIMDSGMVVEAVAEETTANLAYYFAAIQKGVDGGVIKSYPVELIGAILYQDIVAVMNLVRMQPDTASQEALIQAGFDIFWNGIKVEE